MSNLPANSIIETGPDGIIQKAEEVASGDWVKEFGATGLSIWGGLVQEEPLSELTGSRGRQTYREMSLNDPMVGAILFALEQLILSTTWKVNPGEGSDGEKAAEFIEQCMNDMSFTWPDFVEEVLTFFVYGWSWFEMVLKKRGGPSDDPETNSEYDDGKYGWRKFGFRGQDTLDRWLMDPAGGVQGMVQVLPTGKSVTIPIQKSLHFKTKSARGNPEGLSILRTAYRPWYFKKKIEIVEGIGIERDLAGLPVLTAPEGVDLFNPTDPKMVALAAKAKRIVTQIRQDAQAGVVKPFGWVLELLSSGGTKQFRTTEVIERYEWAIARCVLAQFLQLGKTQTGSYSTAVSHTELFLQAVSGWLNRVCGVLNRFAVRPLLRMNGFKLEKDPEISTSDVKEPTLSAISPALAELVKAGVLTPDPDLEEYIRQVGHLPEAAPIAPPPSPATPELATGPPGLPGQVPASQASQQEAKHVALADLFKATYGGSQ